jgi:hypothetical protein
MAFTLIFDGDVVGNPFATTTPYGTPNAIAIGNVIERNEELAHRIDQLEMALLEARRRLAKTRATWNRPVYECDAVLASALNETSPARDPVQHAFVVAGNARPTGQGSAASDEGRFASDG